MNTVGDIKGEKLILDKVNISKTHAKHTHKWWFCGKVETKNPELKQSSRLLHGFHFCIKKVYDGRRKVVLNVLIHVRRALLDTT